MLFLSWLVGGLFVLPLALRALGAGALVAVNVGTGWLVMPLAIIIGLSGSANRKVYRGGNRRAHLAMIGAWAMVALVGTAYSAATDNPWMASTLGWTAVLMVGLLIAHLRTPEARWHA